MFNLFYCLFENLAHDNYTLHIIPASGVNPEHLNYFKFIGRCLGLGIFHRRFLDAYFVTAFYKMVLRKKVVIADLESVDADLYRGLSWMLYVFTIRIYISPSIPISTCPGCGSRSCRMQGQRHHGCH